MCTISRHCCRRFVMENGRGAFFSKHSMRCLHILFCSKHSAAGSWLFRTAMINTSANNPQSEPPSCFCTFIVSITISSTVAGASQQLLSAGKGMANHASYPAIGLFPGCNLCWTQRPNDCHLSSILGPFPALWLNVGCSPPTWGCSCFSRNCQLNIILQFNHCPLRITGLSSGRRSSPLPIIIQGVMLFTSLTLSMSTTGSA